MRNTYYSTRITHEVLLMKLSQIESQETAVRTLRGSIQRASVAHAYLFAGPRNCGKTTTAMAFAAALNCANRTPDGDACGECPSCLRISAGSDADVRLISPDGNQTKIDQMQEMIKNLNFAPLSGRFKVFIIEQADTLNSSSENCILKILEEPPSYGVLILLSRNPNHLLPTIRSRCRLVRFRRASTAEVQSVLSKRIDLPEDQLQVIAACSQGTIGRALNLASDTDFMEERQFVFQALIDWAGGDSILGLRTAELLRTEAKPGKNEPKTLVGNLTGMLDHILSWYADLLSLNVRGTGAPVTNVDYLDNLEMLAERYSTSRLQEAIRSIMSTRRYLEGNITPQLALENMFFTLRPDVY